LVLASYPSASHALDFSTNVITQGGVAAGRDIRDSTINIGCSPEQLKALIRDNAKPWEELADEQREKIAELKNKLDLNEGQIRAALNILGEKEVPPERLAARLVEIGERFKAPPSAGTYQSDDSPEVGPGGA
jgi:hypothetical protein